jgi:PD-(D/E)XK nuclease superfamily protein
VTTDQKGAIAEACITALAIKLGIDVYKPVAEGGRYDLIFDLGSKLLRVQCKWAARRNETLVVSCQSARRCADGFIRRTYTADEVDAIAAYNLELDRGFLIEIARVANRPAITLRIAPCRNNQRRRINWADDFDFGATLRDYSGAVAQLGERRHGMPKATGSSPVGSIESLLR